MTQNIWHKTFVDNPIVLRDLRSTMRGTRAFWFQGTYLFLLGVLAVTGYALSTEQDLFRGISDPHYDAPTFSIVDAQSKLQSFYYFIFVTLAGLITLIAPALTATSVSDERSRQSLDLLTTTPLSAPEMLIGKLMSSLAFLGVLLALSLPASALCVLLGGATIGDLLRVYAMLAVDAVVLASIGLYFSCACKNSLHAIIWTYLSVAAFVSITFYVGFLIGTGGSPGNVSHVAPFTLIGMLSPFGAIFPAGGQSLGFGAVRVPVALAMLPAAFLAVRLLLTAATYRFGAYGAESGRSLRKQILLVTGLLTALAGFSLATKRGELNKFYSDTDFAAAMNSEALSATAFIICAAFAGMFALALAFLPALFVPVQGDDAPPGAAQSTHADRDNGYFHVSAMLLPRHAGALPYFYAWLGVAVTGLLGGIFLALGRYHDWTAQAVVLPTVYIAGAGTLLWGVSRLAVRIVASASPARALAFGAFVMLNLLPALPLSLMENNALPSLAYLPWLGSPFVFAQHVTAMAVSGVVALIVGLATGIANPPRKA